MSLGARLTAFRTWRPRRPGRGWRLGIYVFAFFLVGGAVWSIAGALQARAAADELVVLADAIFAEDAGAISGERLRRIDEAVARAESEMSGLGAWVIPFKIAGPAMRIIPWRGGDASEVADLVEYAAALVDAAAPVTRLAADASERGLPESLEDVARLQELLAGSGEGLAKARSAADAATAFRDSIDHERLSDGVLANVNKADRLLETLDAAISLARTAHEGAGDIGTVLDEGEGLLRVIDDKGVTSALAPGTELIESERRLAEAAGSLLGAARDSRPHLRILESLLPLSLVEIDELLEFGEAVVDDVDGIAIALDSVRMLAGGGFAENPEDASMLGDRLEEVIDRSARLETTLSSPPPVKALPTVPDRLTSLVGDLRRAIVFLNDFLGYNGPRTHLVLAQDEEELRPSGGFSGAIWLLNTDGGRLVSREFQSAYTVDSAFGFRGWASAPETFTLAVGSLVIPFRDLNWYTDFPFAAERLRRTLSLQHRRGISAVVAINQTVLARVIDAIGPVEVRVNGDARMLDGEAARAYLREGVDTVGQDVPESWDEQRYASFILGEALLETLTKGSERGPGPVIEALVEAASSGEMRIASALVGATSLLRDLGWDGGLVSYEGDGFYVVESNVYAPKISHIIERSYAYRAVIDEAGHVAGRLDLTYSNPVAGIGENCRQTPLDPGEHCYWMLSRVILPRDAMVTSLPDLPPPDGSIAATVERTPDNTAAVFRGADGLPFPVQEVSGLAVVKPNESLTISMEYDLVGGVSRQEDGTWKYTLRVRRQPGSGEPHVKVEIDLPEAACVISTEPPPEPGVSLIFDFSLSRDRTVTVVYGLEPAMCSG